LLCVTPDRWGDFWHWPARLLLSAVFEAAAVARAGSRCGHGGLPASAETVRRWLESFTSEVSGDLVEVLALGGDGAFGPEAQQAAIDAAQSLVAVRARFDERLRKTVVCVAGWGLDRLAARPPEISAGSWFAAHWMAAASPDHDVWSFVTVGRRPVRRRN
jgi:hypothetical protein